MSKNRGPHESRSLIIAYKELDTISIDEFRDALVEDTHALKDIYNIRYLKGARLTFYVTNEYGEQVKVRRPTGGTIHYMDTHLSLPKIKSVRRHDADHPVGAMEISCQIG